jgi:WD40 repeat protein
LALSLDGDFVASVDSGGSVRVWKVDTGVAVLEREGGSGLSCVSLNPVSNQVAFGGSDGAVEVWAFSEEADDEETGLTARFVERAADSFFEAFGMPRRDQVGRLTELEGRVNALSFSSDGSVLATAREDGEVHLWSPAPVDPEEAFRQGYVLTKRLKGHTLGVTCLSFSWDDLLIYAGGRDGTVRSWSVSDGSELGVFGGHRSEVRGIVTLSDERLVSGSMDGEVRVFDPYWQASRRTIADGGGKSALFVAEDPGGIDAISVSASGAVSREFPEASLVSSYDPPISGGDWTVGALCGERVALAGDDRVIRLFGFAPDYPVRELVGHDGEILALDSDQSGELLLSGGRDRRAILWSKLESENNEEWVMEHSRAVTSVALALDGETCATADSGNVLHSWGVDNREELMKWQVTGLGRVQGLAIQSDGASVACGLKLFAYLFEAGGAGASATFGPHDAEVKCLAFSADGRRLLTGDANGKIYVWDVGGEESLLELEGHAGAINSLGFADDGRTLLSSDSTGSVFAWRSQFDAERYRRWRRLERAPLRAKRIVEHFGGDLSVAAERILSGAPGLSSSDRAVLLILEEAELASSESSESAGDGDG